MCYDLLRFNPCSGICAETKCVLQRSLFSGITLSPPPYTTTHIPLCESPATTPNQRGWSRDLHCPPPECSRREHSWGRADIHSHSFPLRAKHSAGFRIPYQRVGIPPQCIPGWYIRVYFSSLSLQVPGAVATTSSSNACRCLRQPQPTQVPSTCIEKTNNRVTNATHGLQVTNTLLSIRVSRLYIRVTLAGFGLPGY